jgi:hypothetical protein
LLCYNRQDHDFALALRQGLAEAGLAAILDTTPVIETRPDWPQLLASQVAQVAVVAFLIGPTVSLRQKQTLGLILAWQAQRQSSGPPIPLVPVLLPGADLAVAFLFSAAWVDLRQAEKRPAGLARLVQAAAGTAPARPVAVLIEHCPYRGLQPFREEDAAFFFGREALITRLRQAVQNQAWTTLVGPAGSGKTSLVQAGLLPALRRQSTSTAGPAVILVDLAEAPFDALAGALLRQRQSHVQRNEWQALAGKLAAEATYLGYYLTEKLNIGANPSGGLLILPSVLR